jgi:hypothetical protein
MLKFVSDNTKSSFVQRVVGCITARTYIKIMIGAVNVWGLPRKKPAVHINTGLRPNLKLEKVESK